MKISTKLNIGFLMACFLPLIAAVGYAMYTYNLTIWQEAENRIISDAKAAELLLKSKIDVMQNRAVAYANAPGLSLLLERQSEPQLQTLLDRFKIKTPLEVVLLSRSYTVFPRRAAFPQYPAFLALQGQIRSGIIERPNGELMIAGAAPVVNQDDNIVGVVIVQQALLTSGILDAVNRETGANAYLTLNQPEAPKHSLLQFFRPKPSTLYAPKSIGKILELFDMQGKFASFFVVWRSTEAYDQIRYTALLIFGCIGIGAVVLAALLRYTLTRTIVRPIHHLKRVADCLSLGDYSIESHLNGYDEIGQLGKAFNVMRLKIQASLENCASLNALLEERAESLEFQMQDQQHRMLTEFSAAEHAHTELDITHQELTAKNQELHTALRRMEAMQQQLLTQEKLASLGELTAGIAHEIKNPLNFINSFLQMIIGGVDDLLTEIQADEPDQDEIDYWAAKLPELANKCLDHSNRAVRIIHGMLDHSRGESGERKPTNLNLLCREYVNLAYHGMRATDDDFDVAIDEDYDAALSEQDIMIVPQDISRVILNLARNSFYATQKKAKLYGLTGGNGNGTNTVYSPEFEIHTNDLGGEIGIKIRDNGIGISAEALSRIFEPFFTTKPTGEGTGLGLSMTHEIVTKEHGGKIWAKSEEGRYTEFTIILPKILAETGDFRDTDESAIIEEAEPLESETVVTEEVMA